MSDSSALDSAELARRARMRAGVESAAPVAGVGALAAALDQLAVDAIEQGDVWVLPEGAHLRGARSAALRFLRVFTDRQCQLDSTLVSAIALLVEYCGSLETQIEQLTARLDVAEHVESNDEVGV